LPRFLKYFLVLSISIGLYFFTEDYFFSGETLPFLYYVITSTVFGFIATFFFVGKKS